jgi:hypothetical protein
MRIRSIRIIFCLTAAGSLIAGYCVSPSFGFVVPARRRADVEGDSRSRGTGQKVLPWSLAPVGGLPPDDFVRLRRIDVSEPIRDNSDAKVRDVANSNLSSTGATFDGIGSALAHIST